MELPFQGGPKGLQQILATHGYWLEEDDAVRLTEETRAGMPLERLMEEAAKVAKPFTPEQERQMRAAGIMKAKGGL